MYYSSKRYQIGLSEDKFLSMIQTFIEVEEENTVKNHLYKPKKGHNETVRGTMKSDSFIFWRSHRNWNGIFYPIFKCELSRVKKSVLLNIVVRFNPFAEVVVVLWSIVLILMLGSDVIIQENNEIVFVIKRVIISIVLFLLFHAPPLISYYDLKKQTIEDLEKSFNLKRI